MKAIVFADTRIDRAGDLRTQPEALAKALADADTRCVVVRDGECLTRDDRLALLPVPSTMSRNGDTDQPIFLGRTQGRYLFCVSANDDAAAELDPHARFAALRDLSARLSADEAGIAAYATAMVRWQARHRHCGVCGAPNRAAEAGFVMACSAEGCGHRSFPRLDPAIIVLTTHGNRCLLGRKSEWPEGRFSTIAGFVEPGESLEDAVRREVREETNVAVGDCVYLASQPWPFPAALMIGFHARADTTDIACNDEELAEACWATRDDIASERIVLPPRMSIAYRLIEAWFDQYDGPALESLNLPAPPLRVPRPVDET